MSRNEKGTLQGFELVEDANGRCRAEEDLAEIPVSSRGLAINHLRLLTGLRLGADVKNIVHVRGKMLEFKFKIPSGYYRAFFYIDSRRFAMVLRILSKKKQRFSEKILRDIERLIPE